MLYKVYIIRVCYVDCIDNAVKNSGIFSLTWMC